MPKAMTAILNSVLMVTAIAIASRLPAEPGPPKPITRVSSMAAQSLRFSTYTTQPVWVHQCAQMSCGYHAKPAGSPVRTWCWQYNEGRFWDLITTTSPWNSSILIAGYADEAGVRDRGSNNPYAVPCSSVGLGNAPLGQEYWLHSCDRATCGYGVSPPLNDMASVCVGVSSGMLLVVDHSNPLKQLAGFVPAIDWDAKGGDVPYDTWC